MKYRNTKTGAVIDIKSKITGGNWQVLEPAGSAVKEEVAPVQTQRKVSKKKNE